jgi:fused signal recognition particle receptor
MPPFNWFNRGNQKSEPEQPTPTVQDKPQQEQPAEPTQDAGATQPAIAEDYLSWAKAAYQNIQKQKVEEASPQDPSDSQTTKPASSESDAVSPVSLAESEASAISEEALTQGVPVSEAQGDRPTAADTTVKVKTLDQEFTPIEAAGSGVTSPEASGLETPGPETPIPEASILESPSSEAPSPEAQRPEPSTPEPSTPEPSTPESSTPEPSPAAQEALPFWAKAEAERQERLEKLKSEAIVEPEPEAEPTVTERTPVEAASERVEFDENFLWSAGVLAAQGRRPDDISEEEITWLKRLRQGLGKTRRGLINQLRGIVGQGPLNQDAVMEIESLLLQADVGIEATDFVIEALQERMRQETLPPEEAIAYLKEILRSMLDQPFQGHYEQTFAPEKETLNIWLITGVNGAGKTTTIGKLAHMARKSEYRCLIAAADTFRAAAVEQVKIWGQRSHVDVIANPGQNTDPAAVVFDAITAAKSRDTELLLVDTAGRLQNKKNLMAELGKIRRILDKKAPDAKIESLLVLDATLGQNGLRQAEVFSEAAQLSGVVLTKLDGTAKGGVALAVVKQLGLPLRFIGAGEGIEDLRPFSSYEFVEALLSG